jgi:hypothetical protein
MTQDATQKFESWAIAELLGHKKIAGFVSEHTIGGTALLRIDVPETANRQAYTKYFGEGSIYCLTPTTEPIARAAAEQIEKWSAPIPVDIPKSALLPAGTPPVDEAELVHAGDDDDGDFDF